MLTYDKNMYLHVTFETSLHIVAILFKNLRVSDNVQYNVMYQKSFELRKKKDCAPSIDKKAADQLQSSSASLYIGKSRIFMTRLI